VTLAKCLLKHNGTFISRKKIMALINDGELPNPKHPLYSLVGALLLPHCNGTVLLVGGAVTAPPRLRSDGIV
jgi:hypothetical protein